MLGFIAVVLLSGFAHARCPDYANDKIQYCVQPVAEYAKVLNKHDNNTKTSQNQFGNALQLPKLGGQVFRELCKLIRDFEVCVADFREPCPKHITINLIEASYGFLCNEGYETFMNSAECLMELDQQPAVQKCHDETLKKIEEANNKANIRMEEKLGYMCGALNYFSACVRRHIWLSCGVEAWHVIFRVLKDTTRTLMPTCAFNGESAKLEAEREAEFLENQTTSTHLVPVNDLYKPQRTPDTSNNLVDREQESLANQASAISFEIHEDSESSSSNYAQLGGGSFNSSGSHNHIVSYLMFILGTRFILF